MSEVTSQPTLKIVIVGHVDHGKSTLVGRLFHDTGSLPDGKVEAIQAMCAKRGMPFEWAFVMDALKAERDQGITIDVSQIWFKTAVRDMVLIDAPGHKEFVKNMVCGAAQADAAVLVVDALEGVREQTRRHGYLLHLLGIRQVAVAINKMDLAGYAESRFEEVSGECLDYLGSIGLDTADIRVVPVCGRDGDNIAKASAHMPWYDGPTVVETLEAFHPPAGPVGLPLRFPLQDVYKLDERRILAGRIESGRLHVGDEVLFSPSGKKAKVATIESWNTPGAVMSAHAGQSVGITLDEQIFVERGDVTSHEAHAPMLTNVFKARLFWLGHAPLEAGKTYKIKLGTAEHQVEVQSVERVIDVEDLSSTSGGKVERNAIGEVILRSRGLMTVDPFTSNMRMGRFVLVDGYDTVGGGLISMDGYADQRPGLGVKSQNIARVAHRVGIEERWRANGHRGGILWLTGLSGSGKSTLGFLLEQHLFRKGCQVYVLDGDNVRHGLSADLGFSPDDRAENIRRIGEEAGLFARAGVLVITAFISPYRYAR